MLSYFNYLARFLTKRVRGGALVTFRFALHVLYPFGLFIDRDTGLFHYITKYHLTEADER